MISLLIISFIIGINAFNKFNELCQTYHQEEFTPLFNQFKKEYKKDCPNGMYYGFNGTDVICMKCVKGNYIKNNYLCCSCGNGAISTEDNFKTCQECPQKYGANKDNTECIKCPKGTYSNSVGSGCISCGKGKYTNYEGSTSCLNCPKGEGVNSIGDGCEKCPIGTYSPYEGSGCIKCHNGSISTTIGSTECIKCPVGYGANKERTKCELCTMGLVSEKEGDGCHLCKNNGTATVSDGATECLTCPRGSCFDSYFWYSFDEEGNPYWDDKGISSSIACVNCFRGYYGPGVGEGCLPCPKGTISSVYAAPKCTNCTKG